MRVGSLVGLVLVLVACGPSHSDEAITGAPELGRVRGTVTSGPSCPVVSRDMACVEAPAVADIRLYEGSTGALAARTRTDEGGRFEIAVPPGRYEIQARATGFGPSRRTVVRVTASAVASVELRVRTATA